MNIIKPTIILDTLFQSSNIPETDYTEWSAATTYDEGDFCIVTTPNIHKVYECLQTTGAGDFEALSQEIRAWIGMAVAPNGNVYAFMYGGDIYMQTAGAGDFVALSQTNRNWYGMAAAPNGNVYACVYGGDIYMQTAGVGDFVALSQTIRNWDSMAAAPNGNVYASVYNGDIYMRTAEAGDFAALNQEIRGWRGMAAAPDGNVYVCVSAGDIYMQTAGVGDFVALSQTIRNWDSMAAAPNGNVYACVYGGDIYMQTAGAGDFEALSQTNRNWRGMAAAPNGNIYACVYGGDIYMTGANLNKYPPTYTGGVTPWWLEIGATNRWKIFDAKVQSQASQATSLNWVLNPGLIDSIALLNIDATSTQIIMADQNTNLVVNGTAWTGATGVTPPNSWDLVGSPSDFLIDSLALKITADAANEGISQTITVVASTEMQLLGIYRNTAGDIAQYAVYDMTHSADILATTDLASSTVDSTLSYVFTTPAGCTSIKISLLAKTATDIVWFDTVSLSKTVYNETSYFQSVTMAGNFAPLGQTTRNWYGMAAAPNGNIYACVNNGDIYMQTAGAGDFVALSQTTRNWRGMAAAPNGNVYACVAGGDIYMQTAGAGAFVALSQTTRNWVGMAAAPNGNVYASVYGGDIYMRTAGAGAFVALSQTTRNWYGIAAAPNGNVYASVYGGDIYMRTAGAGAFVALSQTTRNWVGMAAAPNGNVYACVYNGDIYMQTAGTGDFAPLGQTTRVWNGMTAAPNGNVYASVDVGDIYRKNIGIPKTDLVITDLPFCSSASVEVIVSYLGGTTKCGEIVVGLKFDIGKMGYAPSIGIIDYSIKTVDAFGNMSITERAYSKRMFCDLLIANTVLDNVFRQLVTYRATPIVYVGSENYSALIIYGFYKSFEIVIPYPNYSEINLEIEGLI